MAVSKQRQENKSNGKTNLESPGHSIMYVKIKPEALGLFTIFLLNLALLSCLTHSLGGLTSLLGSSTP